MEFLTRELAKRASVLGICSALVLSPLHSALAENEAEDKIQVSNSLAGNYLAARIAATDRDTANAAAFYRKAISLDPDNISLKIKGFLSFVGNGDFAEGVSIGNEIIQAGNESEIVELVLAVEDIRKKDWASAERRLTKDWRSAVDRLMAGLVLGWAKLGSGDLEGALTTVDGLRGPAWFDLFVQYHGGLIALTGGDVTEGVRRLQVALDNRAGGQAAPDTYSRIQAALIGAYAKADNAQAALDVAAEALRRLPQNPVFTDLQESLQENRPIAPFAATAQIGAAEVFLNLGTAINREGGQQFARIYMQLASTLAPEVDAITVQLAELFDDQGMLDRANDLFGQIADDSPYHPIAQLERALNLDEMGRREDARAELDRLIEASPDDLIAHLSYGAVLARHDQFADAIGIYQRIVARIDKPERVHWNLYYRLGIAYERTKQWPLAEAAFKKALELYPDQPRVLNYMGYSWVDMDINLEEGLELIRKAVSLRPNDGYMVDSLGWAYYKLGRIDEAVVELERAVELRPGDPTINDHLGDAYWKAGRQLEATFQWQHALALDPPEGDIDRIREKLAVGLDEVERRELASEEDPNKG
ncbi:MAG: tetratricopeptide repeat protein [Rhizobiaceae bacterium]|nr:tetratricopeptide repeat protein [Hyphomicrobiales bacterium]NRB29646.1 tetratricopeptide repeat protein [Rhizobiaceae bacterium]